MYEGNIHVCVELVLEERKAGALCIPQFPLQATEKTTLMIV